jgi:hypothetical protein
VKSGYPSTVAYIISRLLIWLTNAPKRSDLSFVKKELRLSSD